MPDRFVLDSYALLALFQNEPGATKVQALLEQASRGECELFMSAVNLGEVAYTIERRRGLRATQSALAAMDQIALRIVDVNRALALATAHLKATKALGYADAFAAALAEGLVAAVVTGDPDFRAVKGVVAVEWLARRQKA